jgi:hypothetical protein
MWGAGGRRIVVEVVEVDDVVGVVVLVVEVEVVDDVDVEDVELVELVVEVELVEDVVEVELVEDVVEVELVDDVELVDGADVDVDEDDDVDDDDDDDDVEDDVEDVDSPVSWCTNASVWALVSLGTRLVAEETKPTQFPSPLMADPVDAPFAWLPALSTLSRVVWPVARSCTNTSRTPLVSTGTRFDANDSNATFRPSALIAGPSKALLLLPSPWLPELSTLTRVMALVVVSTTKTSPTPLVSPGTRSVPAASNAT